MQGYDAWKTSPPSTTTENTERYINRLTRSEQEEVAQHYLDYSKGWERYHEANTAREQSVREYVERLTSFWDYINV